MGSGSLLALVARIRSQHCRPAGAGADLDLINADDHGKQAPDALLLSFHLNLEERLQQLQLQGSGSAHINWLLDALASTLSTHASLHSALSISTAAGSATPLAKAQYTHLANQRADEVVSLLDVCSALNQVAHDVEHQLGNLQQALQSVGQALAAGQMASADHQKPLSSGRIRAAARRLSACLNVDQPHSLLHITGKQYRPLAQARASLQLLAATTTVELPTTSEPPVTLLSHAMDGTMLTSLLVLSSALSSLQPAPLSPRKSSGAAISVASKVITKYLRAKSVIRAAAPWAAPLRQLQRDLRQEEMGGAAGGALFQELHTLHAAANNLHASITNPSLHPAQLPLLRQSLDCLRKSSQEAQACVTMLRMHMASLFQALLALRLALLHA
eukprot:c25208_g1_i5 orf=228-1391(+)